MKPGKLAASLMDRVTAYRLWQAPFAEKKLEPFLRHGGAAAGSRVLDVGCGPGTNARHFAAMDYLGVDLNEAYVAHARRRYGDRFAVADVTREEIPGGPFDCILVNSLLHHLATADVRALLARLASLLTPAGSVHILDLVMPERSSLARLLARWDRGDYPRPLAQWRALFAEAFAPEIFEPYPLGLFGMTLWHMVYFRGKASR
jgi:SAM-dependent methyltransferase